MSAIQISNVLGHSGLVRRALFALVVGVLVLCLSELHLFGWKFDRGTDPLKRMQLVGNPIIVTRISSSCRSWFVRTTYYWNVCGFYCGVEVIDFFDNLRSGIRFFKLAPPVGLDEIRALRMKTKSV